MIMVLGIGLAFAAAIGCAGYFAFRSSRSLPGPPPAPSTAALPQGLPLTEASADITNAAEPDAAGANPPPGETATTTPHSVIRPADPPRAGKGPFTDTRQHPRTTFPGTVAAMIYPCDSRLNSEPVQCLVETRDISCAGIGISHTEQLYPSQIIVINALGKLLVGEIRWCHRVDNRYYIAGCRLVKTVT